MSRVLRGLVLLTFVLALAAGLAAVAQARAVATASKPAFSQAPVAGVPFTASGVVRPRATAVSQTVVKVRLYTRAGGHWRVKGTYRAKLAAGTSGTKYARRLTVAAEGRYAVRAFHYRAGKLVATSALASFQVARRVTIDANVNGWLAPGLRDTTAPAGTPLDIVFTKPADWATPDPAKLNGAAHFVWGGFEKVDADGLIWHTDGLRPGFYDWMRDGMPKWGTGSLVVTQRIDVDKNAHGDTHALPYVPADISFGDVSSAGMGCDRSIAFLTRIFTQASPDPLMWHSEGLVPGRYDWKCWMPDCHYGTLVADGAAQAVAIDTDPDNSVTAVPSGTALDLVFSSFSGTGMMCWRTIFFTTAGELTKTRAYPDPLTWYSGGLAPGNYEWECWMGPGCHHGTIAVQ
ncbi:MAG TPA: hypothetical protein VFZ86_01360 [Thermoleophilia bacterium]|nr:hypothetical protein [Thermoleophilia bacterium]